MNRKTKVKVTLDTDTLSPVFLDLLPLPGGETGAAHQQVLLGYVETGEVLSHQEHPTSSIKENVNKVLSSQHFYFWLKIPITCW